MVLCGHCRVQEAYGGVRVPDPLCSGCLCRLVERKVKKHTRLHWRFLPGERVLLMDDGSVQAKVMRALFETIFSGMALKIAINTGPLDLPVTPTDADKVVLPFDSLDRAEQVLEWLMKNGSFSQQGIPFLSCLKRCEVEAYAAAKGLGGTVRGQAVLGLDKLEAQYPGLISGFLKSSAGFMECARMEQ